MASSEKESKSNWQHHVQSFCFESLKAEKEHVYIFGKGRPPKDVDPEVQKYLDFGTENKIHAVATLVGCIMPALLAPCYIFLECGPPFIHGLSRKNLIEVSVDGIVQCKNGEVCIHDHRGRKKIAVEVKCDYPSDDFPKFPMYRLPTRYVPQMLAEMAVHGAEELWLLSYTLYSMTVSIVYFDVTLWGKLHLTKSKYGGENVAIPTKLHPASKSLKADLVKFIDTHTRYICEVPSFRGEMIVNLPDEYISPYAVVDVPKPNVLDFMFLMELTRVAVEECNLLFTKIHEVMREQTGELIMFVISDKDQMQSTDSPTSAPLDFALKGSCLSNKQLHHLINTMQDECKKREIPILAECYDGQWQITVMTSEDGEPLNLLRLAHGTWSKISKMGKLHILEEILSTNKVSNGDKDLLMMYQLPQGITEYYSISIQRKQCGLIHVQSTGGPLFSNSVAGHLVTCSDTKLWLNTDVCKPERRQSPKQIGLKADEINLLLALPRKIREQAGAYEHRNEWVNDEGEDTEYLPDLNGPTPLQKLLTSEKFKLIQNILEELQEHDMEKWGNVQVFELYPDILKDSEALYQKCRVAESAKIAKVLESYTQRYFFSHQFMKAKNVNIICKAFEGSNFLQEQQKTKNRMVHTPRSLMQLSKCVLMFTMYPTICLQVSYAKVVYMLEKVKWQNHSKIPLLATIPRNLVCQPRQEMHLFCYPEYNSSRKQVEPCILDYLHILTNMCMHICKTGYDFCKMEHYIELCHNRPDILSQAIVLHRLVPMNVYTTVRFFGEPVQEWMESKGYKDRDVSCSS